MALGLDAGLWRGTWGPAAPGPPGTLELVVQHPQLVPAVRWLRRLAVVGVRPLVSLHTLVPLVPEAAATVTLVRVYGRLMLRARHAATKDAATKLAWPLRATV